MSLQKREVKNLTSFFMEQKELTYKKGDIIIRLDDTPQGIYFLENGYIKVYSLTENGEENIQFLYKSGEIFPITWVFSGKNPNVYYQAHTNVTLRRVSKEVFLTFIKSNNEILISLVNYLAKRMDITFDRINNLELTNSYQRVIAHLLYLAKYFGNKKNGKVIFDLPIAQKDIAQAINITRETASKEMNILEKRGILICHKRNVLTINDIHKLRNEFRTSG